MSDPARPEEQTIEPTTPAGAPPAGRERRVGRRPAVKKAGAAIIGGVTLGAIYTRPTMLSVGVQEVYAAGSAEDLGPPPINIPPINIPPVDVPPVIKPPAKPKPSRP
jgi:hypothetical protein